MITIQDGYYGPRAVLQGGWSSECAEIMKQNNCVELELNQGKGWRGTSIGFVSELSNIKSFDLFDFNIKDISAIQTMSGLRHLGITAFTNSSIDFSIFDQLESLEVEWRKTFYASTQIKGLKDLFLNKYPANDIDGVCCLKNLRNLTILNASIHTLEEIEKARKLTHLRIGNLKKIDTLKGLGSLFDLKRINIHTCKGLSHIEEVQSLVHLEQLSLNNCGKIASLQPIGNKKNLSHIVFYESTNIEDGDLSILFSLSNLKKISFQDRKHYTHTREEIKRFIQKRTIR